MVWLWGWHVFFSVLNNKKRKIYQIVTLKKHYQKILDEIDDLNVEIVVIDKYEMDSKYGKNNQGIAIKVDQIRLWTLKEWIKSEELKEKTVLVACDLLEDPHNLGAIIRTSKALGAAGILITKSKTVPLTGVVAKSAAGALELIPIIQVSNLACALTELKEFNYRIYGLDHNGQSNYNILPKSVVVLGQEGNGLRELTKKRCDDIISIHTNKEFPVLNVSVSAGIILHEFCVEKLK